MKALSKMNQAEIAAYVQTHLEKTGIEVVLSGGAAVGIFSDGEYVSKDIDLVNTLFENRRNLDKAMNEIGFSAIGRHYEHPDTDHIIEFPPGPLHVGDGRVTNILRIKYDTGILRVISPTDCVKDRLAHYYHWGDKQCLKQALMVSAKHKINLKEIEDWSKSEGKLEVFLSLEEYLSNI